MLAFSIADASQKIHSRFYLDYKVHFNRSLAYVIGALCDPTQDIIIVSDLALNCTILKKPNSEEVLGKILKVEAAYEKATAEMQAKEEQEKKERAQEEERKKQMRSEAKKR